MLWFTADWHLFDKHALADRPFTDLDQMHEAIVGEVNHITHPSDELFIVGDLSSGPVEPTLEVLKKVNVENITLIPGDHDPAHPVRKDHERAVAAFEQAGITVADTSLRLTIMGVPVTLNHFTPTAPSLQLDRYDSHRPKGTGDSSWLVCGHIHSAFKQNRRTVNVGLDAWAGMLVSEYALGGLMMQGPATLPAQPWR